MEGQEPSEGGWAEASLPLLGWGMQAGPVVPGANVLRKFHLRANFLVGNAGRRPRAAFGSKQTASGESHLNSREQLPPSIFCL